MSVDLVQRQRRRDRALRLIRGESASSHGRLHWIQPFHVLVPIAAAAALILCLRPVADPDVYWHVRLGDEIVRLRSVSGAGAGWSILPPAHSWTSPEWLSDIALHASVAAFGWRGMLVFQAVLAIGFLVALGFAVLPGRDPRAGAAVFAVTAVTLASYL